MPQQSLGNYQWFDSHTCSSLKLTPLSGKGDRLSLTRTRASLELRLTLHSLCRIRCQWQRLGHVELHLC